MNPRQSLPVALLLSGALLLTGNRATAATGGASIDDLTVRGGIATMALSVPVPTGVTLQPDRTEVTVNGHSVVSHVLSSAASSSGKARTAVLVVDTSGSMGPGGISAARAAANAYMARVAADVRVGLIGFADHPRVVTSPTTDRASLRSGLAELRSKGETALYDAVEAAVPLAGPNGAVVVLSDGADTVSHASLSDVLGKIQTSSVRVSTVAFRTQDGTRGPLTQIARAGGGRVVAASDASDLAAAFAQAAAALPAQVRLSVELPDQSGGQNLTVHLFAATSTWSADAVLPSEAGSGVVAHPDSSARSLPTAALVDAVPWYASLGLVLAVVFVALFLIGWLLFPRPVTAEDKRTQALAPYGVSGRIPGAAVIRDQNQASGSSLVELSQRFVDKRGTAASIAQKLEQAGSRLRPGEWIVLRFCAVLALAAVITVLFRNPLVGVLCGIVFGWAGSYLWLRHRQLRRSRAFSDALPDTLHLVASSLRTGFSLQQALDAAQQDGVEPMAGELGRALASARIGAPLEDELEAVADRTMSEDWRWAVMAIRIQRSVGGNLAEVLLTTVKTLRDRAATRRLVRSLSAEGRLSAYILLALPLFIFGLLFLTRRQYVQPLWTTTPGLVMISAAGVLMAIGTLWMRNVIRVEA
ncbi:MAG: VWA domain-containing protein [Actinomycetales bacterium]